MSGGNFEGADFASSNLRDVNFKNANLKNAKMQDIAVDGGTNFRGADVAGVDFRENFGMPAGFSMKVYREILDDAKNVDKAKL